MGSGGFFLFVAGYSFGQSIHRSSFSSVGLFIFSSSSCLWLLLVSLLEHCCSLRSLIFLLFSNFSYIIYLILKKSLLWEINCFQDKREDACQTSTYVSTLLEWVNYFSVFSLPLWKNFLKIKCYLKNFIHISIKRREYSILSFKEALMLEFIFMYPDFGIAGFQG